MPYSKKCQEVDLFKLPKKRGHHEGSIMKRRSDYTKGAATGITEGNTSY